MTQGNTSNRQAPVLGNGRLVETARRVSNWGRWGPDDHVGTANLIDIAARQRGRDSIQTGEAYSLALAIDEKGPTGPVPGRGLPRHTMTAVGTEPPGALDLGGSTKFTDDAIEMPLQSTTQWDGLAHIFYNETLYNGHPSSAVDAHGASVNSVHHARDRLVGRAVLLDYAGADAPEGRQLITVEDLDRLCEAEHVEIQAGDMVLLRTGSMAIYDATRSWGTFRREQSGLAFEAIEWLHRHDVAAVACDNATVELAGAWDDYFVPFHMLAIRDMGLWLGEYWYLEELARACRTDGRWTCLLSAPPMPIVGAVGSPVNPIAIR